MPGGARFLTPLLVALALLLGAGLFSGQAQAHGQGKHAAQARLSQDTHGQTQTGQAMPHCHIGAVCAPAIDMHAIPPLAGPDAHATVLRGDHAAPLPPSRSPAADPPPPRA